MDAVLAMWEHKEALMTLGLWGYVFHCERRNHEEHLRFRELISTLREKVGEVRGALGVKEPD